MFYLLLPDSSNRSPYIFHSWPSSLHYKQWGWSLEDAGVYEAESVFKVTVTLLYGKCRNPFWICHLIALSSMQVWLLRSFFDGDVAWQIFKCRLQDRQLLSSARASLKGIMLCGLVCLPHSLHTKRSCQAVNVSKIQINTKQWNKWILMGILVGSCATDV